jgi:acetyl/propionyl-CoA carboxylase alpha subunit
MGPLMERRLVITDERGEHNVSVFDDGRVTVDDVPVIARITGPGEIRLGPEGATLAWVAASGDLRWVFLDGSVYELEARAAGRPRRRATSGHSSLSAPMPATVIRVEVSPGGQVRRGDTLVILEAMKMELPIRADTDGTVASVSCKPGDLVQPGVPLVEIE